MRAVSANLKAHLAQPYQTMCSCWRVTLTNGTVLGFTDHDQNIVISGWTGGNAMFNGTYQSIDGYNASANTSSAQMDVDQVEATGPQVSPAIVDADVHAGLWDFAQITLFQVNYNDLSNATGCIRLRDGWLGQVSTGRNDFKAELRGMAQAYTRTIGRLVVPACDANLGDARCTVNLTPFTVSSNITGVNPDNMTLYDTARTEPGPSGGLTITGVSNANPGVVTLSSGGATLFNGQVITISGVVGPALINVMTIVRGLSGNTFQLGIDTSNTSIYPPYVSGGTVTPGGITSGYFDNGVLTWTSGANNGLKMEVRGYVPGQITLFQPMPYAIVIGDGYTMHAGCDKTSNTCLNRFNNIVNFRGFPFLPGIDQLAQVGRTH